MFNLFKPKLSLAKVEYLQIKVIDDVKPFVRFLAAKFMLFIHDKVIVKNSRFTLRAQSLM